jgi:putative membrane protein
MMYWGTGMNGWGMTMMALSSLLFWGLAIAAIVALVRYTSRVASRGVPASHMSAPQQLLAERFARGDIDEDEYIHRLQVLSTRPSGS